MMSKEKVNSEYRCMAKSAQATIVDERGMLKTRTFVRFDPSHGDRARDTLQVSPGTIVPFSFVAVNPPAKADRGKQIEHPEKYAQTKYQATLLAELLKNEGYCDTKQEALAAVIKACGGKLPEAENPAEALEKQILDGIERAYKTDELRTILDTNQIKYFKSAKPDKLAKLVKEHGLYDDMRVKQAE